MGGDKPKRVMMEIRMGSSLKRVVWVGAPFNLAESRPPIKNKPASAIKHIAHE